MKRIGIISLYYDNINYGGLLQAYALRKTIENLGYECKQISYDIRNGKSIFISDMGSKIRNFIKYLVYFNWYKNFYVDIKLLKKFELSIPHTDVVTTKTISKLNKDFDAFVCGSDQIWNPLFGWDKNYFLSFSDLGKKKIAYAASMAQSHLTATEAAYALKMMEGFNSLSLREIESITALKKYDATFDAEVMPDPTFLLSADEWDMITNPPRLTEPYIFAYFLGNGNKRREEAIQYARFCNKRIIFISSLLPENKEWEQKYRNYILPKVSVNDFLSLVKYADMVITDSFHGSVFSSIFGIPFVTYSRSFVDGSESMNSRITTFMSALGLDRCIEKMESDKNYDFTSIELKSIMHALKKQKAKGIKFLYNALAEI